MDISFVMTKLFLNIFLYIKGGNNFFFTFKFNIIYLISFKT